MPKLTKKNTDIIIQHILESKTIKEAIRLIEPPITFQTWCNYLAKDPELMNRYHQAKVASCDLQLAELDEELNKLVSDSVDPKGVSIARVNAVKLKQQQIQWNLSKMLPKQYGTSTQLQVSGKKDEPIVFKWQE
tara:strand:- start:2348 stop:2749 length:402 start_codon:yes stop_codon:yes gene_type:complete